MSFFPYLFADAALNLYIFTFGARIREMTEVEASSISALYEIIHDASMVLVQYERSHEFIWPIGMTFGMVKKRGEWLVKQLHWSWPGRGFPAVRLLKNKDKNE